MRRIAAIAAAKTAATFSQGLGLGGGTALPGLVAQGIDPGIVAGLARQLGQGSVLVTGTNGKTTTARLLRSIVQAAGLKPVANRAGSNLMRGIAAALVEAVGWTGELPSRQRRLGVFEVDEATLPEATAALQPRMVVFTNLFRDQLDRYGEVEHVAEIWRATVEALPEGATIVLNADDPSLVSLAQGARGRVLFYGLADVSCGGQRVEHAADARWCPSCGAELAYDCVFYGHLGHWRCPGCGLSRPPLLVAGLGLENRPEGLAMTVALPSGRAEARLPLAGLYNAYNVTAAAASAVALGVEAAALEAGLRSFTTAFGRQGSLTVGGREVRVILAKNPAGLNQVLRTITADGSPKDLLLLLNDYIADGRDVSWIWDVDFELLAGKARSLTVSGRRAWDMALRLKYADIDPPPHVEPHIALALRYALRGTPQGATLYVIPTYTAMLQIRNLLARWGRRGAFWQEG